MIPFDLTISADMKRVFNPSSKLTLDDQEAAVLGSTPTKSRNNQAIAHKEK
jgi:hypothetical protein